MDSLHECFYKVAKFIMAWLEQRTRWIFNHNIYLSSCMDCYMGCPLWLWFTIYLLFCYWWHKQCRQSVGGRMDSLLVEYIPVLLRSFQNYMGPLLSSHWNCLVLHSVLVLVNILIFIPSILVDFWMDFLCHISIFQLAYLHV